MKIWTSRRAVQVASPMLIGFGCVWLLIRSVDPDVWLQAPQHFAQFSYLQLALCAVASAVSLWAVGQYDAIARAHLRLIVPPRRASMAGTIAITLSQTLGFGVLTGAMARWRLLPELSVLDALRLSTFVALSFMAGLAVILAFGCVILPAPDWTKIPSVAVLGLLPVAAVILFTVPDLRGLGRALPLPSLKASAAILLWTAVDTLAAGLALYILLPDVALGFAVFFPVFLLALFSGLIGSTPGGIGPFDLTLITLLPVAADPQIVAALMAFRIIYYVIPALLAFAALARPFGRLVLRVSTPRSDIANAPRAEIGVIRQNGGRISGHATCAAALWDTGQSLTLLCDPVFGGSVGNLRLLRKTATLHMRVPLAYKASARTARAARRLGWCVLHMADEAVLNPQKFDLAHPSRRRLRRKLRCAQKSGVTVQEHDGGSWDQLAALDARWQLQNGRARGGTMGRYCRAYLSCQRVFIAFHNALPVGFVSFHASKNEWCIDLMRVPSGAPDGTMHALVAHALKMSNASRIPRFSLAAVPACPDPTSPLWRWLAMKLISCTGAAGLRQFKSSFGPRWQPLYAASPTRAGLVIALADVARQVFYPTAPINMKLPHEVHDGYELASNRAA